MPHRRLVQKLKLLAPLIAGSFHSLPNIDARGIPHESNPHEHFSRGMRVREFDVRRNSSIPIALKWVHGATAKETVEKLERIVRSHNRKFTSTAYQLIEPKGYPIDRNIVAMAKTDAPTLEEILETHTPRAQVFFNRLSHQNDVTEDQLRSAVVQVYSRTNIRPDNLVLLGVRKRKFVFVPLLDLH